MGKKWAKKYIFFLLGIYSDSARNDSEWLGMDKNMSLNFFTRNEVGIWSDSYLFGRIHSDSYHSARIRSECVGEGKVLNYARQAGNETLIPQVHLAFHDGIKRYMVSEFIN